MNYLDSEPTIWRNGQLVQERDLEASGNPVQEETVLGLEWEPMPVPDMKKFFADGFTAGVHQRLTAESRREAKAWAIWLGEQEHLLESPIYRLVVEADWTPFDPTDTRVPIRTWTLSNEAAEERATRRSLAQAAMGPDDRSPSQMIMEANALSKQARQMEREYNEQQARLVEEQRLDQESIELYRKVERGRKLVEKKGKSDAK